MVGHRALVKATHGSTSIKTMLSVVGDPGGGLHRAARGRGELVVVSNS